MTDKEIIKTNFGLLRWMYGTHENLVNKVGGRSTWKNLSDYALGNSTPAPFERQSIEEKLALPAGWTMRNNKALIELSSEDFLLVESIIQLDTKTKQALSVIIQKISGDRI